MLSSQETVLFSWEAWETFVIHKEANKQGFLQHITFVIHKEANKQGFLLHINSVDPAIRFTVEDNKADGSIPFLHTIVKPEADGSLSITVYRKPTHTDQYLQWDSHHHLSAKFSKLLRLPINIRFNTFSTS